MTVLARKALATVVAFEAFVLAVIGAVVPSTPCLGAALVFSCAAAVVWGRP